ncbi:MAG: phytanoyl-CoA dioxygenase family protein [Caulobacterales bacterium]
MQKPAITFDLAKARETYARDGVVFVPRALDAAALKAAEAAYDWSLAHPGPGATRFAQATTSTFYNDLYNPTCLTGYRAMLEASPLPGLIAALWDAPDVWFMYEQVFLKEGGETRRTPWHQDSSYLAVAGAHLAVAWITFDAVSAADSLEFVRGSHRGVLYNGSRFELGDDTAPINPSSPLPRLPDIEKTRGEWDIVSYAIQPGDLVIFHPATLHGGAPTHPGQRRRTLTLRFFGTDAVYDERPGRAGPTVDGFHRRMKTGDPFRDPSFLRLLPREATT